MRAAERAFNDVHKKYERTKEAIGEFKRNEDALKVRYLHASNRMVLTYC